MPNPPITFPHQRMVKVHREKAKSDFLGIKNENWQSASRDLGAYALQLYLYLASNADNYTLALSPTAVRQTIGMKRSTYHDQFEKLVLKGYLVPSHGNTFEFYEVPQPDTQTQKALSADGLDFEECLPSDSPMPSHGQPVSADNIEIDNRDFGTDRVINTEKETGGQTDIYVPKVKEIVISRPVATGKERPAYAPSKKEGFVF